MGGLRLFRIENHESHFSSSLARPSVLYLACSTRACSFTAFGGSPHPDDSGSATHRLRVETSISENFSKSKNYFIPSLLDHSDHLPYCYYYLRVLYFANFCDLEKIAKLSTRKNFYHHIRHSGVYTITNCGMFSTLEHAYNSLLIVSAFSFLSSRAITSSRKCRLMISMIVGVARANFKICSHRITGARCTIWHVPHIFS